MKILFHLSIILLGLQLRAFPQNTEVGHFHKTGIFNKNKLYVGLNQSFQMNRKIGTSALRLTYLNNEYFESYTEIGRSTLEQRNFASNDLFMAPGHWYGAGLSLKLRLYEKQKKPEVKTKVFISSHFSRGVTNISTHNYFLGASFDNYVHKSNYPNYRSGLMQLGMGLEFILKNNSILQIGYNLNKTRSEYNYNGTYTSPVNQTYGEFPIFYHPKIFGEKSSLNISFLLPYGRKYSNKNN